MTEPRVSFVVIGLDEARQLGGSIRSLLAQGLPADEREILYVDSGSTDGSSEIARAAGADRLLAVERASANAARARNTGLAEARGRFVQFVDGDTRLDPGWVAAGLAALEADAGLAGVEGHLLEAEPDANLYHAVCELDWPAQAGAVDFVGGNALYRRAAIAEAGGFDPRMRLGEEPELGFRMRQAGWRFSHLDQRMARHDLDMKGLRDYWSRGRKSGQAAAMVALATGGLGPGYWSRRVVLTLLHAGWIVGPTLLAAPLAFVDPRIAAAAIVASPTALVALGARKAFQQHRHGRSWPLAIAYGLHTYLFKLPSALGAVRALTSGLPPARAHTPVAAAPASPERAGNA